MSFFHNVNNLIMLYRFSRKEAILITRIERGIDTLVDLCKYGIVKQDEYYHISQYISGND